MSTKDKIILTLGVVALVSFLFVIGLSDRGAVDFYQLHLRKVRLQESNVELREKNAELYRKIQRLRSDLEYVEDIARTELGMVEPGEVVYQFKKKADDKAK